jgi:hypothetical protein
LGFGIFAEGQRGQSSTGPSTYSGTVTPILQWQPKDWLQFLVNPTVSAGTGGSFTNQNPYGSFITAGGLIGAQFWSHLIVEAGVSHTWANPSAPAIGQPTGSTYTSSTGETRGIFGAGYTTVLSDPKDSVPSSLTLMINPFFGVPDGGSGPGSNGRAGGAMLTATFAWRIPFFHPQPPPEEPDSGR